MYVEGYNDTIDWDDIDIDETIGQYYGLIPDDLFRSFLINNGIIDEYIRGYNSYNYDSHDITYFINNSNPLSYIVHAFRWSDNKDVEWGRYNKEWIDLYRKNKKNTL